MKLMLSLPSPFARKVRAVAAERGIALELVEVDVFQADNGVAEANPLRKVPCLVTDDGEAWYDSRVIVELLDGLGDGPRLIPDDRAERLAARRIASGPAARRSSAAPRGRTGSGPRSTAPSPNSSAAWAAERTSSAVA